MAARRARRTASVIKYSRISCDCIRYVIRRAYCGIGGVFIFTRLRHHRKAALIVRSGMLVCPVTVSSFLDQPMKMT